MFGFVVDLLFVLLKFYKLVYRIKKENRFKKEKKMKIGFINLIEFVGDYNIILYILEYFN